VNIYSTVKNSYFNVLICLSFDINQIHISNFLICHAVEVATPDANTVGICLPPLHVGQVGAPAWQSETDLLSSLLKTTSVAHALKVFNAHRTSFVTEDDLRRISQDYGVYRVRVPLSWCFTDADPETDIRTEDHMTTAMKEEYEKDLLEKFTCQDPYYEDVRWPAIPRRLLVQFLRSCAKFGIEASLDLHTYPGATSPGTFSGLWPRPPRFWLHDDPASPHQDCRHTEDVLFDATSSSKGCRGRYVLLVLQDALWWGLSFCLVFLRTHVPFGGVQSSRCRHFQLWWTYSSRW
jgi:hypothetical protein